MKTPEVSIVIVNYNVRDFLINALTSLKKSLQEITHEVYVVDNASLDDSSEVTKMYFPDVNLIQNNVNIGFAKANNIALRRCSGKYILLLNPDTLIQEDTIKIMLNFFYNNPQAGIAGCKILNSDGTIQLACRRSFPTPWNSFSKLTGLSRLFPSTKLFGKYNLTYLDTDKSYEVEAISGSFMMFRREVYEDIGGLDETFFMYGEDLDWLYRASKKNWKTYYVNSTQIIHYKGESTKRSDLDAITKFYEAMHLFVLKHYKSPSLLVPILRGGIFFRSIIAFSARIWKNNFALLFDIVIIIALILLSEFIRFGKFHNFPAYAYPVIFIIPALVYIITLFSSGVYRKYQLSISRTVFSVILAFLILSSLTYFFKAYAFSRAVLLLMSSMALFIIPGWRIIYRLVERSNISYFPFHHRRILGKRTLIAGLDSKDTNFISKIKSDLLKDYNIIGVLVKDQIKDQGVLQNIPILGSISALNGIIRKYNIEEVIFSIAALTYTEILFLISNCTYKHTSFKLIPYEFNMIDTSIINSLENINLVEIDLKINKIFNKFVKRSFDLFFSSFLLIFIFPMTLFSGRKETPLSNTLNSLKRVFSGKYSFVGVAEIQNGKYKNLKIGKTGLTGLSQISSNKILADDEKIKYNIIYARNQTLLLDLEIISRTLINYFKRKNI